MLTEDFVWRPSASALLFGFPKDTEGKWRIIVSSFFFGEPWLNDTALVSGKLTKCFWLDSLLCWKLCCKGNSDRSFSLSLSLSVLLFCPLVPTRMLFVAWRLQQLLIHFIFWLGHWAKLFFVSHGSWYTFFFWDCQKHSHEKSKNEIVNHFIYQMQYECELWTMDMLGGFWQFFKHSKHVHVLACNTATDASHI